MQEGYAFKPSYGTQSLRKHNCSEGNSGPVAKSMPKKQERSLTGELLDSQNRPKSYQQLPRLI